MPTNDNPGDAGTGQGLPSLTIDEVLDRRVKNAEGDRETDNAQASQGDNEPLKAGEGEDGTGEEGSQTQENDDWLSEESDAAKAEDAETPETGQFVGQSAKVRLPDGTVMSVADLIKGNMLQSDYSKKTTETSQRREAAEKLYKAAEELEGSIKRQRDMAVNLLTAMQPQPPDPSLADSDPIAWMKANAQFQRDARAWQQWADGFNAEQGKHGQALTALDDAKIAELEQKTISALIERQPILRDPKKAAKAAADTKAMLMNHYGYRPEEVEKFIDHRFADMAMDATRYRMGLTRSKAALEAKPQSQPQAQVMKPAGRVGGQAVKGAQIQALRQKAANSGSIEDVLALRMATRQ